MDKLTREDLWSLEEYATRRADFRAEVMAHKKDRNLPLGPNATLYFEDRTTVRYQVQEMLRVEKIFEPEGIEDELASYNPLIPDGSNWKGTFMLEFPDEAERRQRLKELVGVEDRVWVRVGEHEKVFAIADEDLERDTEEKTSTVHFVRFELSPEMAAAAKAGEPIGVGIDYEGFRHASDPVPENFRKALVGDLD